MRVEVGYQLPVSELAHCPWNPRGEITVESVADLTASIQAKGLLQDIGVMEIPSDRKTGDAEWWVIYGNRRFVAAKAAGLTEISCKVYSDLSEQDAREITRIENEVRLGIDPLKDAELLHSFIAAGKTYEDVALMFGTSPATVCRREKLVNLDAGIRKIVSEHPGAITTNALENIAVYPDDIQSKLVKSIATRAGYKMNIPWRDVKPLFDGCTRNLEESPFVKDKHEMSRCEGCMKRTGCQADLFGDVCGILGRCLDAKCFAKRIDEWKAWKLDKLIPAGVTERVERQYAWQFQGDVYKSKPSKKAPCAYWCYDEYSHTFEVAFGPSEAAIKAMEAEKKRLEAEANAEQEAKRVTLNNARSKVRAAFADDTMKQIVLEAANAAPNKWRFAFQMLVIVMGAGDFDEEINTDNMETDCGNVVWDMMGDALQDALDDWRAEEKIVKFLRLCPKAKKAIGLTADEYTAICNEASR